MTVDFSFNPLGLQKQSGKGEDSYKPQNGLFGISSDENFLNVMADRLKADDLRKADLDRARQNHDDASYTANKNDTSNKTDHDRDINDVDSKKPLSADEKKDLKQTLADKIENNDDLTDSEKNELLKQLDLLFAGQMNIDQAVKFAAIVNSNTDIENFDLKKEIQTLFDDMILAAENANDPALDNRLQAQEFKDYLQHLLQGIPAESRPDIQIIPNRLLGDVSANLNFDPNAQTNPATGLIATDLSPQALNDFLTQLADQTAKGNTMVVGIVKIGPEMNGAESIYLPQVLVSPKGTDAKNLGQQIKPITTQNAALNASTNSALNANSALQTSEALKEIIAQLQSAQTSTNTSVQTPTNTDTNGQQANAAQHRAANANTDQNTGNKTAQNAQNILNADIANSQGTEFEIGAKSNIARSGTSNSAFNTDIDTNITASTQNTGMAKQTAAKQVMNAKASNQPNTQGLTVSNEQTASQGLAKGINLTSFNIMNADALIETEFYSYNAPNTTLGLQQQASLVTQTQNAAQAHPATQVLVTTMKKAAADGDTKNITVRMDPPDLGKVEVKLEFDGNKKVKAILVFEKQETYNMMQRDAHLLEKALQDSGLDTNSNDLSFELAQDGHFTNDRESESGGQNGKNNTDNNGSDADDNLDLAAESTVNWHIDAATGLTRYDIMV